MSERQTWSETDTMVENDIVVERHLVVETEGETLIEKTDSYIYRERQK